MSDKPRKRARVVKASERVKNESPPRPQDTEAQAAPIADDTAIVDTTLAWPIKRLLIFGPDALRTVKAIRRADDATLLARKGIGPATLAEIRRVVGPYRGES